MEFHPNFETVSSSLQGIVAFKRFILQSEEQFGEINSKENFVLECSNFHENNKCVRNAGL